MEIAPLTLATGCGMSAFHMECLRGFGSKTAGSFGISTMLALTFNYASLCACTTEKLRLLCQYREQETDMLKLSNQDYCCFMMGWQCIICLADNNLTMHPQCSLKCVILFIYLFIFDTTVFGFCCHATDVRVLAHCVFVCGWMDGWIDGRMDEWWI